MAEGLGRRKVSEEDLAWMANCRARPHGVVAQEYEQRAGESRVQLLETPLGSPAP